MLNLIGRNSTQCLTARFAGFCLRSQLTSLSYVLFSSLPPSLSPSHLLLPAPAMGCVVNNLGSVISCLLLGQAPLLEWHVHREERGGLSGMLSAWDPGVDRSSSAASAAGSSPALQPEILIQIQEGM